MNSKIRFVVIGCGHIGRRHADMVRANEACELVAIVDSNKEMEATIAANYGVPFYQTIEDFLASGVEADVACIATPNSLHAAQAIQMIEAGHHVLIEKPIGLHKKNTEEILQASQKYAKKVFCVMQNRYSPPMQWLKGLLNKGILGEIFMVQVHCFWNRDERYYKQNTWHGTDDIDGGTLFTQFSHYVDILYWLFGDIKDINAKFNNYNHKETIEFEDSAFINFMFPGGGMGSLNYTTSVWDKNMESGMIVIAEHGTVKIGGQYMDKIDYCHIKDYELPAEPEHKDLEIAGYKGAKANHYYVIQNIVEVLNNGADIDTGIEDGIKIVEIIENIYALKK